MLDWLHSTIPLWKALHIVALSVWCGALIALPMMLSRHDPAVAPGDYRIIRQASHLTYTVVVTPAGVIAVVAGTCLIFLRQTFEPWLFAKLALVAALVMLHAWIGHGLDRVGETPGTHRPPNPYLPGSGVLICAAAILALVLGKPDLGWIGIPEWLRTPRQGHWPFDVPSR